MPLKLTSRPPTVKATTTMSNEAAAAALPGGRGGGRCSPGGPAACRRPGSGTGSREAPPVRLVVLHTRSGCPAKHNLWVHPCVIVRKGEGEKNKEKNKKMRRGCVCELIFCSAVNVTCRNVFAVHRLQVQVRFKGFIQSWNMYIYIYIWGYNIYLIFLNIFKEKRYFYSAPF